MTRVTIQTQTTGLPIGRAILGGLIGSVAMAMWAMAVAGAMGMGFWTPIQLIAATWYGPAAMMHLSGGVILAGLMTHMMMGALLGIILAIAFRVLPGLAPGRARLLGGVVYGLVVWVLMQFVILKVVDPIMASHMTPWAFALGHMMFGIVAAAFLLRQPAAHESLRTVKAS